VVEVVAQRDEVPGPILATGVCIPERKDDGSAAESLEPSEIPRAEMALVSPRRSLASERARGDSVDLRLRRRREGAANEAGGDPPDAADRLEEHVDGPANGRRQRPPEASDLA